MNQLLGGGFSFENRDRRFRLSLFIVNLADVRVWRHKTETESRRPLRGVISIMDHQDVPGFFLRLLRLLRISPGVNVYNYSPLGISC